ncbi:uncharacterized protein [Clytia hemisphaerica]|uniref:uncharacterized protein n=1 Tax=Clytia hemisphaerica TaxID=252671 RepID=UPI0034D5F28E
MGNRQTTGHDQRPPTNNPTVSRQNAQSHQPRPYSLRYSTVDPTATLVDEYSTGAQSVRNSLHIRNGENSTGLTSSENDPDLGTAGEHIQTQATAESDQYQSPISRENQSISLNGENLQSDVAAEPSQYRSKLSRDDSRTGVNDHTGHSGSFSTRCHPQTVTDSPIRPRPRPSNRVHLIHNSTVVSSASVDIGNIAIIPYSQEPRRRIQTNKASIYQDDEECGTISPQNRTESSSSSLECLNGIQRSPTQPHAAHRTEDLHYSSQNETESPSSNIQRSNRILRNPPTHPTGPMVRDENLDFFCQNGIESSLAGLQQLEIIAYSTEPSTRTYRNPLQTHQGDTGVETVNLLDTPQISCNVTTSEADVTDIDTENSSDLSRMSIDITVSKPGDFQQIECLPSSSNVSHPAIANKVDETNVSGCSLNTNNISIQSSEGDQRGLTLAQDCAPGEQEIFIIPTDHCNESDLSNDTNEGDEIRSHLSREHENKYAPIDACIELNTSSDSLRDSNSAINGQSIPDDIDHDSRISTEQEQTNTPSGSYLRSNSPISTTDSESNAAIGLQLSNDSTQSSRRNRYPHAPARPNISYPISFADPESGLPDWHPGSTIGLRSTYPVSALDSDSSLPIGNFAIPSRYFIDEDRYSGDVL